MRFAKVGSLIALIAFSATPLRADLAYDLSRYVGYTIVAVKTVVKSVDDDGEKTSFSGCTYNRIIVFDDGKYVTCASYGYQYAYRPRAIILSNGSSMIMVVGDDIYQVR
jgi:hypothetical protein